MPLPIYKALKTAEADCLSINGELMADWLVRFLKEEVQDRRNMERVVLGLSGGVDSAVVAYLCARAFGPKNVFAFRMPYKVSSPESLSHAQLVIDDLGMNDRVIDITGMVDGYADQFEEGISASRLGNICARSRMVILFDQSAEVGGIPIGTGNKTERFFGYYTWHADDAPPVNPLGDLFKTQVWELAKALGVPKVIVAKPPTADLIKGQTDEGDFGIPYARADKILYYLALGADQESLLSFGFDAQDVAICWKRVSTTHWKRKMPTVAMVSDSAIGEYYLRPVDY